jgi:hypothetical protein
MKKILSLLILSLLVVGLIAPVMAGAQDQTIKECCKISQTINIGDAGTCAKGDIAAPDNAASVPCGTGTLCPALAGNWGMFCLVNVIYTVTNWIFYIMMIAVVIVFVAAGAIYMMSSGDAEKTKSAKGLMIYGIVGLVVALIAKLIPSVVKLIVGM